MKYKVNGEWKSIGKEDKGVKYGAIGLTGRNGGKFLETLDMRELKVDLESNNVKSVKSMFEGEKVNGFPIMDTSKIEQFNNMYRGSTLESNIDFSGMDMSSVTFTSYMFAGATVGEVGKESVLNLQEVKVGGESRGVLRMFEKARVDVLKLPKLNSFKDKMSSTTFSGIRGVDGNTGTVIYVYPEDEEKVREVTELENVEVVVY